VAEYSQLKNDIFSCSISDYQIDIQVSVDENGGNQDGHINIMATSFSGGRSRSTQREPPTMGKQLVNFITCELSAPIL
jgi:hypothetical protein